MPSSNYKHHCVERSVEGKGENEKWEQAEQCEDLEAESHGRERPAYVQALCQCVLAEKVCQTHWHSIKLITVVSYISQIRICV